MAPLARPVDPKLQQEYFSAARRLSHPDAAPVAGSNEGHKGLQQASTASKDAAAKEHYRRTLSRGNSPVPEGILEAAARRISKDMSGALSPGRASPVSRSPRVSGTISIPCTPPASLGVQSGLAQHASGSSHAAAAAAAAAAGAAAGVEAARRRLSMTSNDAPPENSLKPYLASQQVGDFCLKRANEKAALVQYMQSRSHTVGAVLGMRPSSSGPSEQAESSPPGSRTSTVRAPGEFITASTAPMPRRESLQSYLEGQQPLHSTVFSGTPFVPGSAAGGKGSSSGSPGAARSSDLTFTTSGRLESHWTDTEVLLTTRGSWQQQDDTEGLASGAERSESRHSVVKGSVQRRLSSADALGEVASLHSTVGEVRSLLVQEARAKLATAEGVRGPAAAAGAKQQPKQQVALTTDDSEDWREAKRAARAGPLDAGRRKRNSSSRPVDGGSSSEEEMDVYGRNAARQLADWQQLKRSSQGSSGSSSSDEDRQWKSKKKAGAAKGRKERRNSSSSSSSSDGSWFTTLAARRLASSTGGAAKVAVQTAAQRYSRAKDMASADGAALGAGRAAQVGSSRQMKTSASSAGRLQRAPVAPPKRAAAAGRPAAAHSSSSEEETPHSCGVTFTGLAPPTNKRYSVAGRGPLRAYMPSFAGWQDSSDGGVEAAARRSVGGAAGGSRRGTKEQLEHWNEVQRRLSQDRRSSGGSSRRSSASSGSSMAGALSQLPEGMRRAMQRVSMTN